MRIGHDSQWYKSWFDTPYYHILYKKRDYHEARYFLDNLISKLKIATNHQILDLACGRGRFVHYLSEKGFIASGLDLSKKNIEIAKEFDKSSTFIQQDMRLPFGNNKYDFVFNLFTSFGYFNNIDENIKIVANVYDSLKKGGVFVFDYFNVNQTISKLIEKETIINEGIKFSINRERKDNRIIKHIRFNDNNHNYHHTEDVELIDKVEFEKYLKINNLKIIDCFGDYSLKPYHTKTSKRMIVVSKKG